jgi:hypothetical protein
MCRSCATLGLVYLDGSNKGTINDRKPAELCLNIDSEGQPQRWFYLPLMCSAPQKMPESTHKGYDLD